MKYKNQKRASGARGGKRVNKFSIKDDHFFQGDSKKRRRMDCEDENIDSDDSSDVENGIIGGKPDEDEEESDEFAEETADERRKRLAEETLKRIREAKRKEIEDEEDADEDDVETRREREGERDSLVAKALMQQQLEESGRVRRVIASRLQKPESGDEFRILVKHRQAVTAVALSDDDTRGFSASKDGAIVHWDVSCWKSEKYKWPNEDVLKSHGVKDPQGRKGKHSRNTLSLAVSTDGRYLATGGSDRHIHLWDTRTREHIQAFSGHRGPISCLSFRQGTTELFSGSYDRTVKIWNVEDRAYMSTLFGHQSEVVAIDCLRRERVLTVGRDRTMQLFKVPEESRLIFRAPRSSLECCCFISNDEFLSGSDDGSIELWGMLRKKPVCIVKNAHPILDTNINVGKETSAENTNGHLENDTVGAGSNNCLTTYSWVSSVTLCRGSDLAASGAGNGSVRLWAVEGESKSIRPLYDLPLAGFVNSMAIAKSGQFVIAGVGREPRLGKWGRIPDTRDGVAIHPLRLSQDER